jgi:hypothetical protein
MIFLYKKWEHRYQIRRVVIHVVALSEHNGHFLANTSSSALEAHQLEATKSPS